MQSAETQCFKLGREIAEHQVGRNVIETSDLLRIQEFARQTMKIFLNKV